MKGPENITFLQYFFSNIPFTSRPLPGFLSTHAWWQVAPNSILSAVDNLSFQRPRPHVAKVFQFIHASNSFIASYLRDFSNPRECSNYVHIVHCPIYSKSDSSHDTSCSTQVGSMHFEFFKSHILPLYRRFSGMFRHVWVSYRSTSLST